MCKSLTAQQPPAFKVGEIVQFVDDVWEDQYGIIQNGDKLAQLRTDA